MKVICFLLAGLVAQAQDAPKIGTGAFLEMGPRFAREWPVYFFVSVFAEIGTGYVHHPIQPLKGTRFEGIDRRLESFNIPTKIENLLAFHFEAGVKSWIGAEFGAGLLFAGGYDPLGYFFGEAGYILPHYGNEMLQKTFLNSGVQGAAHEAGDIAKKVVSGAASGEAAAAEESATNVVGTVLSGWTNFEQLMSKFRSVIRWLAITTESGFAVIYYLNRGGKP